MSAEALEGGFANAPIDAAKTFRAALSAMARPGRIEAVSGARPPAPLSPAAGALLLTLVDPEAPVHLAGLFDAPEIREWISFHTLRLNATMGEIVGKYAEDVGYWKNRVGGGL